MPDPDATAIWSAFAAVAGDCNITPSQMAHALEAARPLIDAEATARERQRIRQELRRRVVPFRLQLRDVNVDAVEWDRIELVLDGDGDAR